MNYMLSTQANHTMFIFVFKSNYTLYH